MLETKTNPLDTLPIGPRDRAWMEDALEKLWDDPVPESEFDEALAGPYGREVCAAWEGLRSVPLVRYPDHRRAKYIEDFGHFDPIPSRQNVMDALEEAAREWQEELA